MLKNPCVKHAVKDFDTWRMSDVDIPKRQPARVTGTTTHIEEVASGVITMKGNILMKNYEKGTVVDNPFFDEDQPFETPVKCPHCFSYNTYGNYDAELSDNPEDQPSFICINCERGFNRE